MGAVESAVLWALSIAGNSAHGYDQTSRWGPDYDCSSLVISAFEQAGIPVKTKGATYTGNMRPIFLLCGFEDVTNKVNLATGAGMKRGDVLLNIVHHTALHIGDGKIVHASANERGGATGGKTGDQTGGEICTRSYYNSPWDCVLRYPEGATTTPAAAEKVKAPELLVQRGDVGQLVKNVQALLYAHGYFTDPADIDGEFGTRTYLAVISFQKNLGLEQDGIVGPITMAALCS